MNNPTPRLSIVLFLGFSFCANGATGIFREVPLPAASAGSTEIIRGPDGAFWLTEFSRNKVGRIRPDTGQITEFDIPSPNSGPLGIGDGLQDLAVANNYGAVSILTGRGDGTFGAAELFGVGPSSSSLAVADFDGDGRPDVATSSIKPRVSVLINDTLR